MNATVADEAGAVGFVAFAADPATRLGVIEMLAVDPNRQGAGIGIALTSFALRTLRDAGMRVAMVVGGVSELLCKGVTSSMSRTGGSGRTRRDGSAG